MKIMCIYIYNMEKQDKLKPWLLTWILICWIFQVWMKLAISRDVCGLSAPTIIIGMPSWVPMKPTCYPKNSGFPKQAQVESIGMFPRLLGSNITTFKLGSVEWCRADKPTKQRAASTSKLLSRCTLMSCSSAYIWCVLHHLTFSVTAAIW